MRYRSYYYDTETGYYYLQSRYYEPEMCRFINSDEPAIIALGKTYGTNAFSYCNNNPVMDSDPSGYIATNILSGCVGALVTVLFDFVGQGLTYWCHHNKSFKGFKNKINWWSIGISAATGFASGLIISSKFTELASAISGGVMSGLTNIANCIISNKKINIASLAIDVAVGIILGSYGGKGVGAKYFKKSFLTKGGAYFYPGTNMSSTNLKLIKPVVKDFAKSFKKYIISVMVDYSKSKIKPIVIKYL